MVNHTQKMQCVGISRLHSEGRFVEGRRLVEPPFFVKSDRVAHHVRQTDRR